MEEKEEIELGSITFYTFWYNHKRIKIRKKKEKTNRKNSKEELLRL